MKSILVIGMGRFGMHLALKMANLGNDVMVIDKDSEIIDELAPYFTDAQIGDCTREAVLRSIGINNFDCCYVTTGESLAASLEITYQLKELGAKHIVAKISNEKHAKFLLQVGADEIVYPEKDMAEKIAIKHNSDNIFDYIELTPSHGIFEIPVPSIWEGKSVSFLNVRRKYRLNILAIADNDNLLPLPGPDYIFKKNDKMIVLGEPDDVFKLNDRI